MGGIAARYAGWRCARVLWGRLLWMRVCRSPLGVCVAGCSGPLVGPVLGWVRIGDAGLLVAWVGLGVFASPEAGGVGAGVGQNIQSCPVLVSCPSLAVFASVFLRLREPLGPRWQGRGAP